MVGVFPALFAPYLIAQLLGGTLAALIASNVFGFTGTANSLAVVPALLAEILGTFALGAFNPAVAVGISIAGIAAWGDIWIYLLGTVTGGRISGDCVWRYLRKGGLRGMPKYLMSPEYSGINTAYLVAYRVTLPFSQPLSNKH